MGKKLVLATLWVTQLYYNSVPGSAGPHAPQATEISQAVHIIFIITEVGLVQCQSGHSAQK